MDNSSLPHEWMSVKNFEMLFWHFSPLKTLRKLNREYFCILQVFCALSWHWRHLFWPQNKYANSLSNPNNLCSLMFWTDSIHQCDTTTQLFTYLLCLSHMIVKLAKFQLSFDTWKDFKLKAMWSLGFTFVVGMICLGILVGVSWFFIYSKTYIQLILRTTCSNSV